MLEETFSIKNAWSVDPPCYIRKVDRASHWQDSIQEQVFRLDDDGTAYVPHIAS
jgi:hypothetical protein